MKARNIKSLINDSQTLLHELQSDNRGFEQLAGVLKSMTGINLPLNSKNLSLMASRLNPILRDRGLSDYREFFQLISGNNKKAIDEFIEAMTTNTTYFFREPQHFDLLTKLVAARLKEDPYYGRGSDEIRMWCSASSTGQEPYTILMTLLETFSKSIGPQLLPQYSTIPDINLKFLATDIDREVLTKASMGKYSDKEIEGISEPLLQKYFTSQSVLDESFFIVKKELRNLIKFAQFNLLDEPYPFKYPFDYIFCRNVLIYFDAETTRKVVDRLALALRPGGILFLGHSESGMVRCRHLKTIGSAAYQRI